jgi:hypothetical protein
LISRGEFERLEGVFHDGLGTFFELLVANRLIEELALAQPAFDVSAPAAKMQSAMTQLGVDPRRTILQQEIENMSLAAARAAALLQDALAGQMPSEVIHCAGRYMGGLAADLQLIVPGHESIPIALKTDKSGKVALADIGQTSNLYKWFFELFQLTAAEVDALSQAITGLTLLDARRNFQNIAHLVQVVLINTLGLQPAAVNNLGLAVPTDVRATRHLFARIKFYKSGHDRAIVLVADRRTGRVRGDSLIDAIDPETLETSRVGFTPSSPSSHYHYGSTIGIKYDGVTIFDCQVKHQRGQNLTPERRQAFRDITTRLRR